MVDMEFIQTEITGLYGNEVIKEMNEIIKLYDIYDGKGQEWNNDELDYIPTKKRTNYIKKLIKEEARFLFGKTIVNILIPFYSFLFYTMYGGLPGMIAGLLAFGIPVMNILLFLFGPKKCGFANLIGGVFVVDLEDTYIFENKEELIKMKCEFVKKQSTNKD